MKTPLLKLEHLTISYQYPTVQEAMIIDNADCDIYKNMAHFLQGPNGSGKSSIFRSLLGLQNEEMKFIKLPNNERRISGQELTKVLRLGYIPQFPYQAMTPSISIIENLYLRSLFLESRSFSNPFQWLSKALSKKHLKEFINRLSSLELVHNILDGRYFDRFQTFSGGELQILILAATVSADIDLLVMDEPTAKLDTQNKSKFWNSLAELLQTKELTVLSTTHENSFLSTSIMEHNNVLLKIENKKIISTG